jgi:hypothetical protein
MHLKCVVKYTTNQILYHVCVEDSWTVFGELTGVYIRVGLYEIIYEFSTEA